jgi:hypothetical protein
MKDNDLAISKIEQAALAGMAAISGSVTVQFQVLNCSNQTLCS